MGRLEEILGGIRPIDPSLLARAQERLDSLTKPKGSLGHLEEVARRVVAIFGSLRPQISRKQVLLFAADHGVVEEGVSLYPQEVTAQMVYNFVRGGAAINVLARQAGAEVVIIDIGVRSDLPELPGLKKAKLAHGSANMAKGPAMARELAVAALEAGIEAAEEAIRQGADLLATGDMGIGNTTASSAILAVFSGLPVAKVTGRGTGIPDAMWEKKVKVIEQALRVNAPDPRNPMDVLARVGGLEIAGIAGAILAGAFHRVPVILDGFISGAAGLIASRLQPLACDYLLASHQSFEPGHKEMLKLMNLRPLLDLDLRLGEGTGAALAVGLVEAAVRLFNEMATFEEAGVSGEVT
ncbi:MAG: nicotinate-nucleotide--dimethylbenzimidazole phosphoribosyltransferase [candidate division NC10 bacterium]|nr:nicotinate-nucleotide--dimethylbenzimidazole phosphoribosyltransferase [candidate division NC10 bacterium]